MPHYKKLQINEILLINPPSFGFAKIHLLFKGGKGWLHCFIFVYVSTTLSTVKGLCKKLAQAFWFFII